MHKQSFFRQLERERENMRLPRGKTVTQAEFDSFITEFNRLKTALEAKTAIAVLLQQGGSARSCDGNMTIRLFEIDFSLANLRKTLKTVKLNKAERKLASTFADDIHDFCSAFKIPGNLTQKFETYWISDFQINNPNLDNKLRGYIQSTFAEKSSTPSQRQRRTAK